MKWFSCSFTHIEVLKKETMQAQPIPCWPTTVIGAFCSRNAWCEFKVYLRTFVLVQTLPLQVSEDLLAIIWGPIMLPVPSSNWSSELFSEVSAPREDVGLCSRYKGWKGSEPRWFRSQYVKQCLGTYSSNSVAIGPVFIYIVSTRGTNASTPGMNAHQVPYVQ